MTQRGFLTLAGIIFGVVALAHLLRILMGWPIVIDGWAVPIWLSWLALVIAGGLSISALTLTQNAPRSSKGT